MALNTQNFSTTVQNMVTTIQGKAAQLVDLTVGSVLLALVQAFAGVVLWLQGLILSVAALTRASTSTGSDLDSWMADYNFLRKQATCATTQETIGRYTYTAPVTVATTGTIAKGIVTGTAAIQSQDGTLQYVILPDTTNPDFTGTDAGGYYTLAGGTQSISVLIGCLTSGTVGNLGANQVNTLATALPGIDFATNGTPITDAVDVETDAAFRVRFWDYLASLEQGTVQAVKNAVLGIQAGVTCDVVENVDYTTSTTRLGYFYVVADDGSGNPGSTFLDSVFNTVNVVRPLTSVFEVHGPTLQLAAVDMTTEIADGYDPVATPALAAAAITAYIAALPLGAGLPYTRLAQLAYDASPGIVNVTGVTLNSGTSDIAPSPKQSIKPWYYTLGGATPLAGGGSYVVNDVLTAVGGTFTTAAELTVTSVNGSGAITGVRVSTPGYYTILPDQGFSVTGGTGTGATFNFSAVQNTAVTVA